jgi:hypothetical protein
MYGLPGPIFFEETVNSGRYLSMLRNTFVPHLATGLSLQTQWFMQDGVWLHIANVVLGFLHNTSIRVSSQTDFLIILHVNRTGPRIVLI